MTPKEQRDLNRRAWKLFFEAGRAAEAERIANGGQPKQSEMLPIPLQLLILVVVVTGLSSFGYVFGGG